MTAPGAIPDQFRAFVAEKVDERVERGVRTVAAADLPTGEVEVQVSWSSVNYKDALATIPTGKVARISPLIPGIDLAGTVVASSDASIATGSQVIAHGYELGVARHGGFAQYARVPAGWIVPLPDGLTAREAMVVGTAGFTAALSVARLEAHGLSTEAGPVLVTGASGGVGRTALAILVERGYEAWAATGKADAHDDLLALGAAGVLDREDVSAESPARSRRSAGRVPWTASARPRCRISSGRCAGVAPSRRAATRAAPRSRPRCSRSSCGASR